MDQKQLTPRENALIAYRHGTPAYIPSMYTDMNIFMANPRMERYSNLESGFDDFGCHWTYEPNISAQIPTPNRYLFTDVSEWREKLKIPDVESYDWEKQADIDMHTDFMGPLTGRGLIPLEDGKTNADGDKLQVCIVIQGMFERLHACMGFENALMAIITDPDECYDFFGAIADFKIQYFKKIAQYYPVDVINAHDDYGSAGGLFMSPELWRKLLKPHLKRIVAATHELGLIYQHHSCGYVEPLFADFVEIGIDAIDTLQGCNTHLADIKKKYGDKITFCGGFDNQHVLDVPRISPAAVKAEYRRVIDSLAPGGSYVIYPIGGSFEFMGPFLDEHFTYGMGFYANQANS